MESLELPRPARGAYASTLLLSFLLMLRAVSTRALWGISWRQILWAREKEELDLMKLWNPDWDNRDAHDPDERIPFDVDSLETVRSNLQTRASKQPGSQETCWQSAYSKMGLPCGDIVDFGPQQSRLGLMLTDCFLEISGRGSIAEPECQPVKSLKRERVTDCLQSLDDYTHKIFLTFFMNIVSECQLLESEGFKQNTKKAIANLYETAHTSNTVLKLITREVDTQRGRLYKLTGQIMDGQKDLLDSQARVKTSIDEGLTRATARTKFIAEGLKDLQRSQTKMQSEYGEVTRNLGSDMQVLRMDLDKINQVVDVLQGAVQMATEEIREEQGEVMVGFRELWGLMQESRLWNEEYVRKVKEAVQVGHEVMLDYKTAVDRTHHHLLGEFEQMAANNKWITEQLEDMHSKLKTVLQGFMAMNESWWMNSHVLTSILTYLLIYVAIYITTMPRQTQNARLLLSVGFLVSFASEMYLMYCDSWRIALNIGEAKRTPSSRLVRYTFYVLGGGYLLYSYHNFRDYNALNNKMLQEVRGRQSKADKDLVTLSRHLRAVRNRMASANASNREMMAEIMELRKSLAHASSRHAMPGGVAQLPTHRKSVSRLERAKSNATAPF